MSNRRRSNIRNRYRTGYLRSPAWFQRRDQWFGSRNHADPITCAVCGIPGTKRTLELHHVSYRGIRVIDGRWLATETDADLTPLHPYCHELLHRLIDRDTMLSLSRNRQDANELAIRQLRTAVALGLRLGLAKKEAQ